MTKIYVETSSFGFYYDDRSPREPDAVRGLLRAIERGRFQGFTSEVTLEELGRTHGELGLRLVALVRGTGIPILPVTPESDELAEAYLTEGIVPRTHRNDAVHAALAVLGRADVVASNNLKHLANYRAVRAITTLNRSRGLPPIDIRTPDQIL